MNTEGIFKTGVKLGAGLVVGQELGKRLIKLTNVGLEKFIEKFIRHRAENGDEGCKRIIEKYESENINNRNEMINKVEIGFRV